MLIFESLLTTFEAIITFKVAGEVTKIDSSLILNHHNQI